MDAARFFAPDFVDSGGMPLKGLECQVSNLVNSDPCPRPTTDPRDYHDRYRTSMKQAMLFVSHRADPDVQPAACRRFDEAGDASVGRGKRDVPTRALADRFSCDVSLSDDDVFSTAQILYGATKDKAHLRQVTMRLLTPIGTVETLVVSKRKWAAVPGVYTMARRAEWGGLWPWPTPTMLGNEDRSCTQL